MGKKYTKAALFLYIAGFIAMILCGITQKNWTLAIYLAVAVFVGGQIITALGEILGLLETCRDKLSNIEYNTDEANKNRYTKNG